MISHIFYCGEHPKNPIKIYESNKTPKHMEFFHRKNQTTYIVVAKGLSLWVVKAKDFKAQRNGDEGSHGGPQGRLAINRFFLVKYWQEVE
jgi:hypothetical protein